MLIRLSASMKRFSKLSSTRIELIHRVCQFFSFNPNKLQFKDLEEQAIASYITMDYIEKFYSPENVTKNCSLREKLEEMTEIKQIIINQSKFLPQYKDKEILSLSQVGFQQSNIDQVLKAFHIDKGTKVNSQIWSQNRFYNAQRIIGSHIHVLNPTLISAEIINYINIYEKRAITEGQKGTGKSFSFLIYSYLSQYLINYRLSCMKNNISPSERFINFVKVDKLEQIKKLFYLPIRKMQNQEGIIRQFSYQVPSHLLAELKVSKPQFNLSHYLEKIAAFYTQKIKTALIIDEANEYFKYFRKKQDENNIDLNKLNNNELNSGRNARLYSQYLQIFEGSFFDLYLLNSSQSVQAKLIQKWNNKHPKSSDKYYDFFNHNMSSTNYVAQYTKKLSSEDGQKQLYYHFWFQFSMCCIRKGYTFYQNTKIREIFQKSFGLHSSGQVKGQQQKLKQLVWWNIDVRHLQIRQAIEKFNFNNMLRLSKLPDSQKKSEEISQQFLRLKKQIQSKRFTQFVQAFTIYQTKSQDTLVQQVRLNIRLAISYHARLALSNSSLMLKPKLLEVNFRPFYQKLTKDKNSSQISKITEQFTNFTQYIGQGFTDSQTDQLKLKCYFFIDPSQLELLNFVDEQVRYNYYELKWKNSIEDVIMPLSAGWKMDDAYYKLFKQQDFVLKMKCSSLDNMKSYLKDKTCLNTFKYYHVKQTFGYLSSKPSDINFPKHLLRIFQAAQQINKNDIIDYWIGGYPIMRAPLSNEQIFGRLNTLFDFILIRKCEETNKFIINSFDFTVGVVFKKIADCMLTLLKQKIQSLNTLREKRLDWKYIKFEWQHIILAPQENIYILYQEINKTDRQRAFIDNKVMKQIDSNKDSNIPLKVGLMVADFSKIHSHFKINGKNKNLQQRIIYQTMQQILKEKAKHFSLEKHRKDNYIYGDWSQ